MLQRCALAFLAAGWMLAQEPQAYTDPAAYDVYAALLRNEWTDSQELVIRAETVTHNICNGLLNKEPPAIENYFKINQKTWLLRGDLMIGRRVRLVPGDDLKKVLQGTTRSVAGFP